MQRSEDLKTRIDRKIGEVIKRKKLPVSYNFLSIVIDRQDIKNIGGYQALIGLINEIAADHNLFPVPGTGGDQWDVLPAEPMDSIEPPVEQVFEPIIPPTRPATYIKVGLGHVPNAAPSGKQARLPDSNGIAGDGQDNR